MPIPAFHELKIEEAGNWILPHLDVSQVNTYLFLAHMLSGAPIYLLSQEPHAPHKLPHYFCLSIATREGIQHHLLQLHDHVIEIKSYGHNILSRHETSLKAEEYIARLTETAKPLSQEELQHISDNAHAYRLSEIAISTGLDEKSALQYIKTTADGTLCVVQEKNALRLYENHGDGIKTDLFQLKDDGFYNDEGRRLDKKIEQLKKRDFRLQAVHFQMPTLREEYTNRQALYLHKLSELKYQIESFLFIQDFSAEKSENILRSAFYNQHRTIITSLYYLEGETTLSEAPFSYTLKGDPKSPIFIQSCAPQSIDGRYDLSYFTEVTPCLLPVDAVLTALSTNAYQSIQRALPIGSPWPSIDAVKEKLREAHFPDFICSEKDAESYLERHARQSEKIAWHSHGELWVSASTLTGMQHGRIAFNHFDEEGVAWKAADSTFTTVCIKQEFQAAFQEDLHDKKKIRDLAPV